MRVQLISCAFCKNKIPVRPLPGLHLPMLSCGHATCAACNKIHSGDCSHCKKMPKTKQLTRTGISDDPEKIAAASCDKQVIPTASQRFAMETVRDCGCKGIRTCLTCEEEYNIEKADLIAELKNNPSYVYCPECNKAWPGWDPDVGLTHPNHTGDPIAYPGVYIENNFLEPDEANNLLEDLDCLHWERSQSGRRKQNYGPKCNFKKRRLRVGNFDGFPCKTKYVQDRLSTRGLLKDFQTIEQCSLEYTPERGASIDPHIDDCWIWGERIVTVNVIGDSTLTMTRYRGPKNRYNLDDVATYPPVVRRDLFLTRHDDEAIAEAPENAVIRLPMPARSLIVLYGSARYDWEHAVLREDIDSRRVCIAYREFTPPYLPRGDRSAEAKEIFEKALNFW